MSWIDGDLSFDASDFTGCLGFGLAVEDGTGVGAGSEKGEVVGSVPRCRRIPRMRSKIRYVVCTESPSLILATF